MIEHPTTGFGLTQNSQNRAWQLSWSRPGLTPSERIDEPVYELEIIHSYANGNDDQFEFSVWTIGDEKKLYTEEELDGFVDAICEHVPDDELQSAFNRFWRENRRQTESEEEIREMMIARWNAVQMLVSCAVTL